MKAVPQLSLADAVQLVRSGDTLLVGGFGMTGHPVHLLHALAETEARDLTYVGNNVGEPGLGGGRLLRNGQIRKAIGSYFTSNADAVKAVQKGELEIELLPQGTLVEAIRSAGAGLGGFYTPTSAGTDLAEGRESRMIDDREMVFIPPLSGDVALIRAWRADRAGNLQYRMTEANFNIAAATAADTVIAEVEEIVPVGSIPADQVHTAACFVDYLVEAKLKPEELGSSGGARNMSASATDTRLSMARAALSLLTPGDVVNLGIGIPTLVADLITPEEGIILHSENGMLGVGPAPEAGGAMEYPVNAGKTPVTAVAGASYFDSATSFAMIRGGHVDVAIMGGFQVDERGSLSNWSVPGKPLLGVGGAMDLAVGARKLIVMMMHCDREGNSKVLRECDLPLTAERVVDVLITDLAVFRYTETGMRLERLMPGATLEQVASRTMAQYEVALAEEPGRRFSP